MAVQPAGAWQRACHLHVHRRLHHQCRARACSRSHVRMQTNKACPFKSDPIPYPSGSSASGEVAIAENQPTAVFTITVFVKCKGQGDNAFCGVVNPQPFDGEADTRQGDDLSYRVEVWNSRPTSLWVAALICAFIGPILLIAFLIYERGVLAKQA